jgi:hypothetical protein
MYSTINSVDEEEEEEEGAECEWLNVGDLRMERVRLFTVSSSTNMARELNPH